MVKGLVQTIVLRDDVSRDAVLAFADSDGWTLREETSRAHLVLASRRWSASVDEEITYVADHLGGAHSLRVSGAGAEALAIRLREHFAHHGEDELLGVVLDGESEPAAWIRVASKLSACRPPVAEPRHLRALEALLSHPAVAVRRAGIRSAYSCRWPELRELVARRRAEETELREQLEHLERYLLEDEA